MGVYLNTFRTEHKTALLNGEKVKVYAYRYLCRSGDEEPCWSNGYRRHAAMMRAQCERAQNKFDKIKPQYAVGVCDDNEWAGIVYTDLPGALHYDDGSLGKTMVGFLRALPRGYVISPEYHGQNDNFMCCGHSFIRRYVDIIEDNQIKRRIKSYYCKAEMAEITPEQFDAWRDKYEPAYLAECKRINDEAEAARKKAAEDHAKAVQAKKEAKDAEIRAARESLARLEQERMAIY